MCKCNNKCVEPDCGCKVFLTTDCVTLTEDLTCSGILKGQTETEVLKKLDKYICDRFDSVTNFFDIINVGTGLGIYKGVSNIGKKELKTLLGSNLITLTSGTNEVTIAVNEAALNTFIEANQKTYSALNSGTGAQVYKDATITGDNTQLNFRSLNSPNSSISVTQGTNDINLAINPASLSTYSVANSGTGTGIYTNNTVVGNNTQFNLQSIASDTLIVSTNGSTLRIEQPVDLTLKSFYVNESFTGDSLGTIGKPFKKLTDALIAAIGTGTLASPQFAYASILLQSDVSVNQVDLSTKPILENKISVNTISILSDNTSKRTINYFGNTEYPMDTNFLISKVGLDGANNLLSTVYLSLQNIRLACFNVKGIVNHNSYSNGTIDVTKNTSFMVLTNSEIISEYHPSNLYVPAVQSNGVPIKSFGAQVFVQDSIVNDTPHINIYGTSNNGEGSFSVKECLFVGTSQTTFKIENTSFSTDKLTIIKQDRYLNTANKSVTNGDYQPKINIPYIETNNSFVRISNFSENNSYPYNNFDTKEVAVTDVLFRTRRTNLSSRFNRIIVEKGSALGFKVNYITSIDNNVDFNLLTTNFEYITPIIGAFKLDDTFVSNKFIIVEGSTIRNVKDVSISKINVLANEANINGYNFTSSTTFPDDTSAKAGGLIVGNIYYNTTINAMKKIV